MLRSSPHHVSPSVQNVQDATLRMNEGLVPREDPELKARQDGEK